MVFVLPGVLEVRARFFREQSAFIALLLPTLERPQKITSAIFLGSVFASAAALKKAVFSNISFSFSQEV
jgi:hypothetical protein